MNHYFGNIQPQGVYRAYKHIFHRNLSPFFNMMISLQPEMESNKWIDMVRRISFSVVGNPEKYIGKDTPRAEITTMIIQEVFAQFLEENRV